MVFIVELLLFAISLAVLIVSSDLTVALADRLAHVVNFSKAAVGLLIISIGTSLPELAVAVFAAAGSAQLITMGTLVGSNVTNLTLVLGIAGLFGAIAFTRRDIRITLTIILTSAIGFMALVSETIGPAFGAFTLAIYVFFVFLIMQERYAPRHLPRRRFQRAIVAKTLVTLFVSIALVLMSAKFVIDFSIGLAGSLGAHLSVIGMMIAFGTSLPEVSVAVAAVRARRPSLALGTLVGSSLSNIGLILGLAVFLAPITINSVERVMLTGMLVVNALYLLLSTRRRMGKIEAGGLIAFYGAFVALLAGLA